MYRSSLRCTNVSLHVSLPRYTNVTLHVKSLGRDRFSLEYSPLIGPSNYAESTLSWRRECSRIDVRSQIWHTFTLTSVHVKRHCADWREIAANINLPQRDTRRLMQHAFEFDCARTCVLVLRSCVRLSFSGVTRTCRGIQFPVQDVIYGLLTPAYFVAGDAATPTAVEATRSVTCI